MDDGEGPSQDWKAEPPENRREGQTLSLRQVPQTKPETCQDARPLVLPELPATKKRTRYGEQRAECSRTQEIRPGGQKPFAIVPARVARRRAHP